MKKYPFDGGMSGDMYDQYHPDGVKGAKMHIDIRGPYGLGLGIDPKSKGHFVIIGGGTGILPFLDLFFMLLKKITYSYFEAQNKEVARKFKSKNYSRIWDHDFSVTFYGAFRNDDDFYGKEVIDNLYKVCKETGRTDFFNGILKISKTNTVYNMPMTKERFTTKFFAGKVSNDTERFLICGPPRMMEGTPIALEENGIDPDKIDLI